MRPTRSELACAATLMLSGCVTTDIPRAYSPVVQPPPADLAAFQRDFAACVTKVQDTAAVFYQAHPELKPVQGNGDGGFPGGGGAIGPGDMGAGVITALALVIEAARGAARSQAMEAHRKATERDIQAAMTLCLEQRGHVVTAWRRVPAANADAAGLTSPTSPSARANLLHEAEAFERYADEEPKRRVEFLLIAAEKYERLAKETISPEEQAALLARAAEARRKAELTGGPGVPPEQPASSARSTGQE